jgi:hypothetical protein
MEEVCLTLDPKGRPMDWCWNPLSNKNGGWLAHETNRADEFGCCKWLKRYGWSRDVSRRHAVMPDLLSEKF